MTRRSERYLVANRDLVAGVIDRGLVRYGGNQSRAAAHVKRSQRLKGERRDQRELQRAAAALQRTLSRLQNRKLNAITRATLVDLRTLLTPSLYDELRLAMIPPEGHQALWREQHWMEWWLKRVPPAGVSRKEWEQFGAPARRPRDVSALTYARKSRPLASMQEEGRRLLEALRRAFPDVCQPFEAWCVLRGHSQNRIHVAYARAVEPLLANIETTGIELGWRELEDHQLKRYLDLGLARERLLLTRAPDSQRAAVL